MSLMMKRWGYQRLRRNRSWQSFIVAWRWGPPSTAWGGGVGVIMWGMFLPFFPISINRLSLFATVLLFKFDPTGRLPLFSFHGLSLLKRASALWEKAQQLKVEGLQKIKSAVSRSEAEGFYRLLRGAVSHTSSSPAPPLPKNTIPPQPWLFPSHPLRSLRRWHLRSLVS